MGRAILVLLMIVLVGCSNTSGLNKEQWLKNNFPNRANNLKSSGNTGSLFRDQILAGQVSVGMNLQELLISRTIKPYGPSRFNGIFWCGQKISTSCPKTCQNCLGIVKTKSDTLLLHKQGDKIIIVAHKHKFRIVQARTGIAAADFNFAESILSKAKLQTIAGAKP